MSTTNAFSAPIEIIGINPFVFLPEDILQLIFKKAGKDKSPIPIKGVINDKPYKQTLVHYSGSWRLYINTSMLKNSPKRIGEIITVTIEYDPDERTIPMHPKLKAALQQNEKAMAIFEKLAPSLQKEMLRYIHRLKSEASIEKNVTIAIIFLMGEARFIGRNKLRISMLQVICLVAMTYNQK